jgi:hypothetical protein
MNPRTTIPQRHPQTNKIGARPAVLLSDHPVLVQAARELLARPTCARCGALVSVATGALFCVGCGQSVGRKEGQSHS